MWLFLQIVAGVFVAFMLTIFCAYLFIRWKLRGLAKSLMEAISAGLHGGVPPFRVKLMKRSDMDGDPDAADEVDWISDDERPAFEQLTQELQAVGFRMVEDYYIPELATAMRVLRDDDQVTRGIVYFHPIIGVWCEVGRKYEDDTGWSYSRVRAPGMDTPPFTVQKYFPDLTVEELVSKFREEAPREGAVVIHEENFPAIFEKAYAKEMDWHAERGGLSVKEIRRIAEINEDDCTEEGIRQVQLQWRTAITQFYSERALKRYRKQAELNSFQWEHLQGYGVVIHERMGAEELLQIYDEEYYPDVLGDPTDDEEAKEIRAQRSEWNQRISDLEDALTRGKPQQVFRDMVQLGNGSTGQIWEFQTSVAEPVEADIWTRTYRDEEEAWDDEDS
ncbi:hypothetical protein ACYFX5_04055 [Bremerella sp. T1]|uniref:hypothetical protein n=1 Tax=Bremerella sp. TYQ1 TaxID=3119568 RepID=UPI001CCB5E81|nr:hypothetical protein [Bremerella volcania]UBM37443.1 hypothetical protein LA756_06010 [Bremerella volcania]